MTLPVDRTLEGADWVVLTSAATLPALAELGLTIPTSARVAAVGEATAEAVRRAGHSVDLVPRGQATAAALVDAFPPGPGRVAVPGSALSSPTLATGLEAKGYAVTRLPVYTVEPVERVPEAVQRAWDSGQFDVVVITAGSVGEAFASLLGWRDDVAVVAFGPPSEAALRDAGVPVAATAETQDADGLVQAIGRVWKR
ncbi:uroporphyrinogen-III synthase [Tessaracoccus oleiagri]|uniref:uroporphyrinogen-III synthase n=1 Tax=Tessaracoccus oleiagri TaxID=686624 RepID=UPI001FE1EC79